MTYPSDSIVPVVEVRFNSGLIGTRIMETYNLVINSFVRRDKDPSNRIDLEVGKERRVRKSDWELPSFFIFSSSVNSTNS